MIALSGFGLTDSTQLGARIRQAGETSSSLEEVATRTVTELRSSILGDDGRPAGALVRFYATLRAADLPSALRARAGELVPDLGADVRCLALMATRGTRPEWNERQASVGHQVIPLPSPEAIERLPMVHQLLQQMGVGAANVAAPVPQLFVELSSRSFNIFYVPTARESPHIPAQDFVVDYGIKTVIGTGCALPNGCVLATILFLQTFVPEPTAKLFSNVALSVKLASLRFVNGPFFTGQSGTIS